MPCIKHPAHERPAGEHTLRNHSSSHDTSSFTNGSFLAVTAIIRPKLRAEPRRTANTNWAWPVRTARDTGVANADSSTALSPDAGAIFPDEHPMTD